MTIKDKYMTKTEQEKQQEFLDRLILDIELIKCNYSDIKVKAISNKYKFKKLPTVIDLIYLQDRANKQDLETIKTYLKEEKPKIERKKGNKYNNSIVEVDGIKFHSKKEAKRYNVLKQMQEDGIITDLELQVCFRFEHEGKLICKYYADFVYRKTTGQTIVEDAKGARTDKYILKKKMMKVFYNIEVLET